jgi:hypothetical protein
MGGSGKKESGEDRRLQDRRKEEEAIFARLALWSSVFSLGAQRSSVFLRQVAGPPVRTGGPAEIQRKPNNSGKGKVIGHWSSVIGHE